MNSHKSSSFPLSVFSTICCGEYNSHTEALPRFHVRKHIVISAAWSLSQCFLEQWGWEERQQEIQLTLQSESCLKPGERYSLVSRVWAGLSLPGHFPGGLSWTPRTAGLKRVWGTTRANTGPSCPIGCSFRVSSRIYSVGRGYHVLIVDSPGPPWLVRRTAFCRRNVSWP